MRDLIATSVKVNADDIRRVRRDGTNWLILPVVALREKVLNCLGCHPDGDFVPFEEIVASYQGWEARPVTLGHPLDREGRPVSANTRNSVSTVIGRFWNVRVDAKKRALVGEIWLDEDVVKSLSDGRRLLSMLEDGKIIEVSTGYFSHDRKEPGEFNGVSYAQIHERIVSDHLAVLLDQRGACNTDHGCGFPRAAQNSGDHMTVKERFAKLLSDAFTLGAESAGADPNEGGEMDRATTIANLVANENVPFDEQELEAFEDERLASLAEAYDCGCEGKANKDGAKGSSAEDDDPGGEPGDPPPSNDGGEDGEDDLALTAEDIAFIRKFREETGGDVTTILEESRALAEARQKDKKALVKSLAENEKCRLNEKQLGRMDVDALRALEASFKDHDYSGRGFPRGNAGSDDDGYVSPPAIVTRTDQGGDG